MTRVEKERLKLRLTCEGPQHIIAQDMWVDETLWYLRGRMRVGALGATNLI